jgi:hypothetical protein
LGKNLCKRQIDPNIKAVYRKKAIWSFYWMLLFMFCGDLIDLLRVQGLASLSDSLIPLFFTI